MRSNLLRNATVWLKKNQMSQKNKLCFSLQLYGGEVVLDLDHSIRKSLLDTTEALAIEQVRGRSAQLDNLSMV
ncbi:unnamed protein product [Nippostrongylus brasiliensis]|uniref:Histidine kinase n=1 Tax=Nippostrongylus brasiliensis TaxID=27835 RepID=A0A0N4Y662_NIPBR|nr:unnamed protein product [Nippostrongylus brasiliensis]